MQKNLTRKPKEASYVQVASFMYVPRIECCQYFVS